MGLMKLLGVCADNERDRTNQLRIMGWSFTWVVAWLSAGQAMHAKVIPGGISAILVALLCGGLGMGLLRAYYRYLRDADELQRKIELDALGLSVGAGLLGGVTSWLLEQGGIIERADVMIVIFLICVAHPIGLSIGKRRYS